MTLSPAATLALFAFGTEAVIGFILGTSNGLSEVHKSVLVGFAVVYPLLTMALIWGLSLRAQPYEMLEEPQEA